MAVYTEVSTEALRDFLANYDLGQLVACKGIAEGVENTNYLLTVGKTPYILTLYERRVHRKDLPFFINLMEHLATKGIKCPTPVHDRSGEVLRTLAGRPAAIFTFLDGLSVRRPTVAHCAAVGSALAQLHVAGQDFPLRRENNLSLAGWKGLLTSIGSRADEISPGLAAALREELAMLQDAWPAELPAGVIHADLFPDNVFFLDSTLSGLIDFYFACNDLFAYDVAICLNAWCFEADNAFNLTKARALLQGYRAVRYMVEAETEALPILARGAAVRFLLTRIYDWFHTAPDALVKPKDPIEYWRKLRFHQKVASVSEYGL